MTFKCESVAVKGQIERRDYRETNQQAVEILVATYITALLGTSLMREATEYKNLNSSINSWTCSVYSIY